MSTYLLEQLVVLNFNHGLLPCSQQQVDSTQVALINCSWTKAEYVPSYIVVNVTVFQSPNVLAQFCRVPFAVVVYACVVVSESSVEISFAQSYIAFSVLVITSSYYCLVHYVFLQAVLFEGTFFFVSTIASFLCFIVFCLFAMHQLFVVTVNFVFDVRHCRIANFHCVFVKYFM